MNIFDELKQCFDAKFTEERLEKHFSDHTNGGNKTQLPKSMKKEEYARKGEQVSLKTIDPVTKKNRKVRAAKRQSGEIAKTDGQWFVTYKGGRFGELLTAYPANEAYFEKDMKEKGAKEIFWEQ